MQAKKVPLITEYNHFEFNTESKGKVNCKIEINENEFIHKIFPDGFPEEIVPEGMSRNRKEYLFKNIRNFCEEECYVLNQFLWRKLSFQQVEADGGLDPDEPQPLPGPPKKKRKRLV